MTSAIVLAFTCPLLLCIKSNEVTCTWKQWWHKMHYTHVIILKFALITSLLRLLSCLTLDHLFSFKCSLTIPSLEWLQPSSFQALGHNFQSSPSPPPLTLHNQNLAKYSSVFLGEKKLFRLSSFIYPSRIIPSESFRHIMSFSFKSMAPLFLIKILHLTCRFSSSITSKFVAEDLRVLRFFLIYMTFLFLSTSADTHLFLQFLLIN